MKKIILIFIGLITLIFLSKIAYEKYYFNEEKIKERQIKVFNKTIDEYKNSKSGSIDLTNEINLRWRIKDFDVKNHEIEYCENEFQDA